MIRTTEQKEARKEDDRKKDAAHKRYVLEHPDELNVCNICKDEKELTLFVSNYQFRNRCKECHKKKIGKWRLDKPDLAQAIRKKSFRSSADFIRSLKDGRECSECRGSFHPCQMDFHHLADKDVNISQLYGKSRERIVREIGKCVLICANCHRDETFRRSGDHYKKYEPKKADGITEVAVAEGCPCRTCARCGGEKHEDNFTLLRNGYRHSYCKRCLRDANRKAAEKRIPGKSEAGKAIEELKSRTPCADCGKKFGYWVMDLDHVSGEKVKNLNKMQTGSLEAVLEEISKCEVVCANCHRLRTYRKDYA